MGIAGIANKGFGIANKGLMFLFGDYAVNFGRILARKDHGLIRRAAANHTNMSLFQGVHTAYNDAQRLSLRNLGLRDVKNYSFINYMAHSLKSWGHDIATGAKEVGLWGKTKGISKGLFGGIGKRMPLVGVLFTLGSEIPNLVRAFTNKDGGVGTGLAETGKTGIKLGAMAAGAAAGAAIGSFIFPGLGTAAGAIVGTIGSLIGGGAAYTLADAALPSFTEQEEAKAEKEAQAKAALDKVKSEGDSKSAILPKAYDSYADATGVANSSQYSPELLKLSGLTKADIQRYEQLKAAYGAYTSNPFGPTDYMDRSISFNPSLYCRG